MSEEPEVLKTWPLIQTVFWALLGSVLFFFIEKFGYIILVILDRGSVSWSFLEVIYHTFLLDFSTRLIDVLIALLLPSYVWVSLSTNHTALATGAIRKAAGFVLIAFVASLGLALYWTEGSETYLHIDGPPTTVFSRFLDLWLYIFPVTFFSLTGAWWVHRYFRLEPIQVVRSPSRGYGEDSGADVT